MMEATKKAVVREEDDDNSPRSPFLLIYCPSPCVLSLSRSNTQTVGYREYAHYEYKCSVSEQVSNNEPVGVNFIHTVNCNIMII